MCSCISSRYLLFNPHSRLSFALYRIIEIEWAAKNGNVFNPSPKRPKKTKAKKKTKVVRSEPTEDTSATRPRVPLQSVESDDDNVVEGLLAQPDAENLAETTGRVTRSMATRFGAEKTNSPTKRRSDDEDAVEVGLHTPKRTRKEPHTSGEEEW
jgi:kinesin family protein 22